MPQNVGNILRTAMATNSVVHIIGPIKFEIDDKSLQRVGMDYIKEAKYVLYRDYEEFEQMHRNAVIYYVTRYSSKLYTSFDFSNRCENLYFMFGNESTWIDKRLLKSHLNFCLRIPMMANARSLNLSNSVAIVLYEVLRQQKFSELATIEIIKGEHTLD